MPSFSFSESRQQAEEKYGLESGGPFKAKEGANKIRLLSPTIGHQGYFNGQRTFKYVCWVFDYAKQKVRLYFMPSKIHKAIESLQVTEEYAFEEVPMPYDITINAKNAGTKEVDYQVMPARANTPIPAEAETQLADKENIEAIVAKLKENEAIAPSKHQPETQKPEPVHTDDGEITLSDIPF